MPRTPDPRRSPMPYGIQARVTPAQYAALLSLAEARDIPLSAAVRVVIDAYVDQVMPPEARAHLERGTVVSIEPDAEWVRKHGTARPPA